MLCLLLFAAVATSLFSVGCVLSSRERSIYYALDYPAPAPRAEHSSAIKETLMIYRFLVSPDVELDSLVIKSVNGKDIKRVQRWQENPADTITDLLIRDFQEAKVFSNTVDQLSNLRYRYALEGILSEMGGAEKEGKISLVLGLEVTLIDFEPRLGGKKQIMNKRYRMEVPSQDSQAASVIKAFNQALTEFSEKLQKDVEETIRSNSQTPVSPPRKGYSEVHGFLSAPSSVGIHWDSLNSDSTRTVRDPQESCSSPYLLLWVTT